MPRGKAASKGATAEKMAEMREKAKAAREAKKSEVEAAKAKAEAELAKEATKINKVFERVKVADGRANDLRVTAAEMLAEAKVICEENKIPFKAWVSENVDYSYDECRKLAIAGGSENPAQAIEDMRAGARKRQEAHREKKAAEAKAEKASRATPKAAAETAVAQMDDKAREKFIKAAAKKDGLVVLQAGEAPSVGSNPIETAKFAVEALDDEELDEFLDWLAGHMGLNIEFVA